VLAVGTCRRLLPHRRAQVAASVQVAGRTFLAEPLALRVVPLAVRAPTQRSQGRVALAAVAVVQRQVRLLVARAVTVPRLVAAVAVVAPQSARRELRQVAAGRVLVASVSSSPTSKERTWVAMR
jgi:hypothetical protein